MLERIAPHVATLDTLPEAFDALIESRRTGRTVVDNRAALILLPLVLTPFPSSLSSPTTPTPMGNRLSKIYTRTGDDGHDGAWATARAWTRTATGSPPTARPTS